MDHGGRARDADIDARNEVIAPYTLSTLESLDDDALREVAYRRADSDADRMRARAAARLLASRTASRPDNSAPNAAPGSTHKHQADNNTGISPGVVPLNVEQGPVQDERDDLEGLDDAEESAARRTQRRRTVLAGVIVASLAVGAVAGIVIERTGAAAGEDSLAVFDRPATPQEIGLLSQTFGPGIEGDVRLLREDPLLSAYGVRITSPDRFFFGVAEGGPQICVIAVSEEQNFFPNSCVPEVIFRDQGLSGFLPALNYTSLNPELTGGIGFQWGPRGGIELRDYTDELLGAAEDRFSEEDLARGLDLTAIRLLENNTLVSTADLGVEDVELGPAEIGRVGSTLILGSVRQPTLLVRDPKGETRPVDEVQRIVCLSPLRDGQVVGTFCASMGQFREEGLRATFDADLGTVEVTWSPRGDLSVEELYS